MRGRVPFFDAALRVAVYVCVGRQSPHRAHASQSCVKSMLLPGMAPVLLFMLSALALTAEKMRQAWNIMCLGRELTG